MKKMWLLLAIGLLIIPSVLAQAKINVETDKEAYAAGEIIKIKVSLFDQNNALLNDQVEVVLTDAQQRYEITQTVAANQFVDISLGDQASSGFWTAKATYQGASAQTTFTIELEEIAKFELKDDQLTITNMGNTRYTRTVQILIGETSGIKEPNLEVGESVTYRLLAPEGTYTVKITDGVTSLSRGNVQLTGNVIGVLDDRVSDSTAAGLTGGVRPDDEEKTGLARTSLLGNNIVVYAFILAVFGAMILLAIEQHFRKKTRK